MVQKKVLTHLFSHNCLRFQLKTLNFCLRCPQHHFQVTIRILLALKFSLKIIYNYNRFDNGHALRQWFQWVIIIRVLFTNYSERYTLITSTFIIKYIKHLKLSQNVTMNVNKITDRLEIQIQPHPILDTNIKCHKDIRRRTALGKEALTHRTTEKKR